MAAIFWQTCLESMVNLPIRSIFGNFPRYNHVLHPKEQGGRVYVEIRDSGEVTFYEGYITDAEAQKIRRALSNGEAEGAKASKTSKPEMSGPMADYMNLHRHSIARAELIKRPDLALRLSVAHMICGARNWKIDGKSPRSRKPETQASVEASKAEGLLLKERQAVCDLLGLSQEHPTFCAINPPSMLWSKRLQESPALMARWLTRLSNKSRLSRTVWRGMGWKTQALTGSRDGPLSLLSPIRRSMDALPQNGHGVLIRCSNPHELEPS